MSGRRGRAPSRGTGLRKGVGGEVGGSVGPWALARACLGWKGGHQPIV